MRRGWTVLTLLLFGIAGCGGGSPQASRVMNAPSPAPSSSQFDFTVGYIPSGYQFVSREYGPPNQFIELNKRYRSDSGDTMLINVDKGAVMTPTYYVAKTTGGFKLVSVQGHSAAVGADAGRGPGGGVEIFVRVSSNLTVDVTDLGPPRDFHLSLDDAKRVALSVKPRG